MPRNPPARRRGAGYLSLNVAFFNAQAPEREKRGKAFGIAFAGRIPGALEVLEKFGVVFIADDVALLPRKLCALGNGEAAAFLNLEGHLEAGADTAVAHGVPVDAGEPGVALDAGVVAHRVLRPEARGGVQAEQPQDELPRGGLHRHVVGEHQPPAELLDLPQHRLRVLRALKGGGSADHLVDEDPEGPELRGVRVALLHHHLRAHVLHRAADGVGAVVLAVGDGDAEAEVRQAHAAVWPEEHVLGLQVPVQEALLVNVLQRQQHLRGPDFDGAPVDGVPIVVAHQLEKVAARRLHHHVQRVLVLEVTKHAENVGAALHLRRHHPLGHHQLAHPPPAVHHQLFGHHLEGDEGVLGVEPRAGVRQFRQVHVGGHAVPQLCHQLELVHGEGAARCYHWQLEPGVAAIRRRLGLRCGGGLRRGGGLGLGRVLDDAPPKAEGVREPRDEAPLLLAGRRGFCG
mmetsp:Transcript_26211/g.56865  ORF Transcript_26211/g.56865 Transcript_26211/m.56865 type:complete len:458 (-) Transcript_26211:76-1449(-)